MSLKKEIKSFSCAFSGIAYLFKNETHAKYHLFVTVCVVAAGFAFGIKATEWLVVLLTIGVVMAAEAFNTAVEKLADVVSPQFDERIGRVKDVAAGAVLICAIISVVIGAVIFLPYIIELFW